MMLGMVPLPMLVGKVPSAWLLGAMVVLMLGFNLIRGFASGAWFPWLANIVPADQRGRFFGRENFAINAGVLGAQILGGIREPDALPAGRLLVRVLWHGPIRAISGLWLGEDRASQR